MQEIFDIAKKIQKQADKLYQERVDNPVFPDTKILREVKLALLEEAKKLTRVIEEANK